MWILREHEIKIKFDAYVDIFNSQAGKIRVVQLEFCPYNDQTELFFRVGPHLVWQCPQLCLVHTVPEKLVPGYCSRHRQYQHPHQSINKRPIGLIAHLTNTIQLNFIDTTTLYKKTIHKKAYVSFLLNTYAGKLCALSLSLSLATQYMYIVLPLSSEVMV